MTVNGMRQARPQRASGKRRGKTARAPRRELPAATDVGKASASADSLIAEVGAQSQRLFFAHFLGQN